MGDDSHFFLHRDGLRVDRTLFDPHRLSRDKQATARSGAGRGEVIFFQHDSRSLVLRHYCRGGLPAHFSADRYLWLGIERTRPWCEYRLLEFLHARQLPAPRAYAAHIEKRDLFYTGDIVTYRIENAETLGERFTAGLLSEMLLERVGATIRRFHDALIDHADLNVGNILLDRCDAVYLIDFDRGRVRSSATGRWRHNNLRRLHRSLKKLNSGEPAWRALCRGYGCPI